MMGACANCEMLDLTLKDWIEASIISEIPEVKEVINVA
jgi:Fe-S cluster biogenesis protein NfuA